MKTVAGILSIFVTLPIWYYLLFHILKAVNASELMWFLFWIYLPIGVLTSIISKVLED